MRIGVLRRDGADLIQRRRARLLGTTRPRSRLGRRTLPDVLPRRAWLRPCPPQSRDRHRAHGRVAAGVSPARDERGRDPQPRHAAARRRGQAAGAAQGRERAVHGSPPADRRHRCHQRPQLAAPGDRRVVQAFGAPRRQAPPGRARRARAGDRDDPRSGRTHRARVPRHPRRPGAGARGVAASRHPGGDRGALRPRPRVRPSGGARPGQGVRAAARRSPRARASPATSATRRRSTR